MIDDAYCTAIIGCIFPTASYFLKHFLDRSGAKKEIDVQKYIRIDSGLQYFVKNVNDLISACENGIKPGATIDIATNPNVRFIATNYSDTPWRLITNLDKFASINCSDALMNATCTNDKTDII